MEKENGILSDNEITALLFERRETGLAALQEKAGGICRSVIRRILDSPADAEETENDLWLAVWNSIPPNRPVNLIGYTVAIARRTAINRYKYNSRQKRKGYDLLLSELSEAVPGFELAVPEEDGGELAWLLDGFLAGLSGEDRALFVSRYVLAEPLDELAKRAGKSRNALSLRLSRLRKQLYTLLEKDYRVKPRGGNT